MSLVEEFIARWAASGGSERANYQLFLSELAALLGVETPNAATGIPEHDGYTFERPVTFPGTGTTGFIDLYKRGSFVLEAKQGSTRDRPSDDQPALLPDLPRASRRGTAVRGTRGWDDAMIRARGQAEGYARALPVSEGWPPFLVTVDVGHCIELYADFSLTGKNYTQYPDGTRFRIHLPDLADEGVRDRLRKVWTDPHALDPARTAARVTREIAARLAALGNSFEADGHDPERVARFLMRCLFSMFAEDVRLIPENSFRRLLEDLRGHSQHVAPTLRALWETMDTGGFSTALRADVLRFNGGLFAEADALPVNDRQLALLIEAAAADWREVEPAIFGTLLERALKPRERHKLGAHYTPRAYVERLVRPTVIEPLRDDFENVKASALRLAEDGRLPEARALVRDFHRTLCETRVLDPACGSGNFLYVALEHMKRLEGEVVDLLDRLGETQGALGLAGMTVDPHQFLGIELNPWAAAVAELVLWIGYLQWHFRTHGRATPAEPVLRDFRNIECRDAVLAFDATAPRVDAEGRPVTRWDGETRITHPVTGERVPDPEARTQVLDYLNPRPAAWPDAEFIVGNPPFIGASRMREALGDGYAEALWTAYPKLPQSADFVMVWWEKAAQRTRAWNPAKRTGTRRFGLITTNSLRQTFNRRVVEPHLADRKRPLSLVFAIPDHPWVEPGEGAAVRIAMTVGEAGTRPGRLLMVTSEAQGAEAEGRVVTFDEREGRIFANLTVGADVASAVALKANEGLSSPGVKLHGSGFILELSEAKALGLGTLPGLERHIRDYRNGRDLLHSSRGAMVIDLYGFSEAEVRERFPSVWQHVFDNVKPEREQNQRRTYRENWWIFGEPRSELRRALMGLPRYIATVETAKHHIFSFLDCKILPDNRIICFAISNAEALSILSSRYHMCWSRSAGGLLEDRPVYQKSNCFDPFPFPDPTEARRNRLRELGEALDAHRKARQAAHPGLTLTVMYNVLEKLRAGEALTAAERQTYDDGLVGVLRELHDEIDAATADAYGWPADLTADEILHRLVALNRERAAEEARGHVRWLRPEFQNPAGTRAAAAKAAELDLGEAAIPAAARPAWPKSLPEQMAGVRAALETLGEATPEQVARQFSRARATTVRPLLETLAGLGHARVTESGAFTR